MICVKTRIEAGAADNALAGIKPGEKFLSNGYEFTVDEVGENGTVWAHRPLMSDEDFERSYAYRTLERI